MKPVLVLALGNPVAGDDAVAHAVAAAASAEPELWARAEFVNAGTDLFRCADALAGRDRVILIDAALSRAGRATVHALQGSPDKAERSVHAHALDPVEALHILRALRPELASAEICWLLIEVPCITLGSELSAPAASVIPEAAARLRALILAGSPRPE